MFPSRMARARVRAVVTCVLAMALGGCGRGATAPALDHADGKEGATGTRARGEEGSMGNPVTTPPGVAASAAAPDPNAPASNWGTSVGDAFGTVGHGVGGGASAGAAKAGAAAAPREAAQFGIIGLLGSSPAAAAERAAPALLDPNARYATTYRPGGAALAAFDAAVARGQIPASYRDLAGDFGNRYAPALPAPADGALSVVADTERSAIGPEGGPLDLRVSIVGSDAVAGRAPLSVHIVLDTSGSMSGQAISDARSAAEAVVQRLAPTDDFSMVTFSNDARLLVPEGPIGPRRAQVLSRIEQVQADGGTNISSGLDLGYAQAHGPSVPQDAVRIVMLLSDGHANAGDTSSDGLARRAASAFQEGVQTSSFGLGPDFDAPLMSGIADKGAGGYYYLADSSQIGPALSREIDARLQPVATAVEVRVRLRAGVGATKVFGSRELSAVEAAQVRAQEVAVDNQEQKNKGIQRDRQQDAAGGMRFFIPAFARGDRHATLVALQLPPGVGDRSIASVEVRYKDRLLGRNVTRELPVRVHTAASDAESAATEDPSVERMALAFAAGETLLQAAAHVDAGDRGGAQRLLDERSNVLKAAAERLHEPRLLEDGARLDRLSAAIAPAGGIHDPLPLVVLLRGSGYGYL